MIQTLSPKFSVLHLVGDHRFQARLGRGQEVQSLGGQVSESDLAHAGSSRAALDD